MNNRFLLINSCLVLNERLMIPDSVLTIQSRLLCYTLADQKQAYRWGVMVCLTGTLQVTLQ